MIKSEVLSGSASKTVGNSISNGTTVLTPESGWKTESNPSAAATTTTTTTTAAAAAATQTQNCSSKLPFCLNFGRDLKNTPNIQHP